MRLASFLDYAEGLYMDIQLTCTEINGTYRIEQKA